MIINNYWTHWDFIIAKEVDRTSITHIQSDTIPPKALITENSPYIGSNLDEAIRNMRNLHRDDSSLENSIQIEYQLYGIDRSERTDQKYLKIRKLMINPNINGDWRARENGGPSSDYNSEAICNAFGELLIKNTPNTYPNAGRNFEYSTGQYYN